MSTISFVVAVIDASPVKDLIWKIQHESRLRLMGVTVVDPEDAELVDMAIVRGENPAATYQLALDAAGITERGALFAFWPDERTVAVMHAGGPDHAARATWMRRMMLNDLSKMDANALESDVISLSASAIRDGVTTSIGVELRDDLPWEQGHHSQSQRGIAGG